jgi:excisionase family DNA binding protein
MSNDTDILTTKELCERLKISRQGLQQWRDKGLMPQPLKPPGGRTIRWRWSDIEAWLLQEEPKKNGR